MPNRDYGRGYAGGSDYGRYNQGRSSRMSGQYSRRQFSSGDYEDDDDLWSSNRPDRYNSDEGYRGRAGGRQSSQSSSRGQDFGGSYGGGYGESYDNGNRNRGRTMNYDRYGDEGSRSFSSQGSDFERGSRYGAGGYEPGRYRSGGYETGSGQYGARSSERGGSGYGYGENQSSGYNRSNEYRSGYDDDYYAQRASAFGYADDEDEEDFEESDYQY